MRSVLALILCSVLFACDDQGDGAAASQEGRGAPPAPQVGVLTVQSKEVPLSSEYAGRAEGSRRVEIRARVEGILLERTYTEGARVEAGDLLFRIDRRTTRALSAEAQAQLTDARARYREAKSAWDRISKLFDRGTISAATRDQARSALDTSKASVAAAEARLNGAQLDLEYTSVEAPISGITSRETVSEGSLVGPNSSNSSLTTITQIDPIYVNFAYPDAEWLRRRRLQEQGQIVADSEGGASAKLLLSDGSTYAMPGTISFTETTVDPSTGTIRARAVFPNPDGLVLPGQFVRVVTTGLTRRDAIAIPQKAVQQGPRGTFVYRVNQENVAEIAPVELGATVGDRWIVEKGLNGGDRVVVDGVIRVRPGSPVKVADAGEANGKAGKPPGTEQARAQGTTQ